MTHRYLAIPLSPLGTFTILRRCGFHDRAASTSSVPRLDIQSIEAKWHQQWAKTTEGGIGTKEGAPRSYVLPMFPYPSGTLHIGHLRVYTISDVLARFKCMQGHNVLHPMGWDAFGLPAENAAIEQGVDPAEWTKQNIGNMKSQLRAMGGSFDWSREFMTCDPEFYKHTQRLFLMLHQRGFAYQAEATVNYDPIDKTVLANEQVDANGCSWRSGAKVKKRNLRQWFLRITNFKEALYNDLDVLARDSRWPERVLSMQRNWLGKSSGAKIKILMELKSFKRDQNGKLTTTKTERPVEVFTTRPDTLHGVQYIALSISHPIVEELAVDDPNLKQFIKSVPSLGDGSKSGYLLPHVLGRNPLSALENSPKYSKWPLPVYVAPYVLESYGEGAVMGVPAHDSRDFDFWIKHNDSEPIRRVIAPPDSRAGEIIPSNEVLTEAYEQPGILTPLCGSMAGLKSAEASTKIVDDLADAGGFAQYAETWRLRDWLISRQRYWGTPIPIIHCQECGAVPVPAEELPVKLPRLPESWSRGKKGNPLKIAKDWVNTTCPRCGGSAKRDTDTMDTFMDSSWYFMRFLDPHNAIEPFSAEVAEVSLPVDIYIGGVEHAILHLLYARFIAKFLATTSLWPSGGGHDNRGEPFRKVINQGMVHGKTYSEPGSGRFLKPEEVDTSDQTSPKIILTGQTPNVSWEKMSKSKHNGVDPMACIRKYGADTTRAHILFQAPVTEVLEWEEERIVGMQRWFGRVWRLVHYFLGIGSAEISPLCLNSPQDPKTAVEKQLWAQVQDIVISVNSSLSDTFSLNTVISDLIKATNAISAASDISHTIRYHATSVLLRMMAPVVPAFSEECWELMNNHLGYSSSSIFDEPFPIPDGSLAKLKQSNQTCAVQENGKWRFAIQIPNPPNEMTEKGKEVALQDWVLAQIKKTNEGRKWMSKGETWKKVVVVKGGKTVNFVR